MPAIKVSSTDDPAVWKALKDLAGENNPACLYIFYAYTITCTSRGTLRKHVGISTVIASRSRRRTASFTTRER